MVRYHHHSVEVNLSKLQEIVEHRQWSATVHGVAELDLT